MAVEFFEEAKKVALNSTCERDRCGSVIVKNGIIIGKGFNSPPKNIEQKRCGNDKTEYHTKVTDKTCCIHAEQRAIIDALRNNPEEINGSNLFFVRLDENGEISFAGKPYCTICSKMALDCGIRNFVLWHKEGIKFYDAEEYNNLSFKYSG